MIMTPLLVTAASRRGVWRRVGWALAVCGPLRAARVAAQPTLRERLTRPRAWPETEDMRVVAVLARSAPGQPTTYYGRTGVRVLHARALFAQGLPTWHLGVGTAPPALLPQDDIYYGRWLLRLDEEKVGSVFDHGQPGARWCSRTYLARTSRSPCWSDRVIESSRGEATNVSLPAGEDVKHDPIPRVTMSFGAQTLR
jgi:hypothetical protein